MSPAFADSPLVRTLDGKCAFRFVFNASSPKPGSLSDTLVCTEQPARTRVVCCQQVFSKQYVAPYVRTCG